MTVKVVIPEPITTAPVATRLSDAHILVLLTTAIPAVALAASVGMGIASEYRLPLKIVVSSGALVLAAHSIFVARRVLGILFLAVLGIYTPFNPLHFSPVVSSSLNMMSLVLFVASLFAPGLTRVPRVFTPARRNTELAQPKLHQR